MLDSVRCDFPTDESLQILNKKVIDMSLTDKFIDLQQSGQSPVQFVSFQLERHVVTSTWKCLALLLPRYTN